MCVRSHIHTAFSSFIQPFTDTVYFYVLAVVNNTPVNIKMQISLQDISFGVYLGVELLGHMVVLFFYFPFWNLYSVSHGRCINLHSP